MIEPKAPARGPRSENAHDYRRAFLSRVHEVLEGGYRRLDPARYATEEEPAITGELRREMKAYLREAAAPPWADNFFVQEEEPVNDGVRKGKSRSRVDIGVECSTPRPGASFSFEAKRLARGYAVGKYLGLEGLGCILCGQYAREDDDAGMIGYVQDDHPVYWAQQIEKSIRQDRAAYEVLGDQWWRAHAFENGPTHVYASTHGRSSVGHPVTVYHSLLLFRPRAT